MLSVYYRYWDKQYLNKYQTLESFQRLWIEVSDLPGCRTDSYKFIYVRYCFIYATYYVLEQENAAIQMADDLLEDLKGLLSRILSPTWNLVTLAFTFWSQILSKFYYGQKNLFTCYETLEHAISKLQSGEGECYTRAAMLSRISLKWLEEWKKRGLDIVYPYIGQIAQTSELGDYDDPNRISAAFRHSGENQWSRQWPLQKMLEICHLETWPKRQKREKRKETETQASHTGLRDGEERPRNEEASPANKIDKSQNQRDKGKKDKGHERAQGKEQSSNSRNRMCQKCMLEAKRKQEFMEKCGWRTGIVHNL
ncbi:hypothetical protein BGW36DRAFT_358033 [Talaromyces proteolyticus]|uniref:Uncharacterized protein n=1 Tax=Talaromyces proteolyticus TaxID=1131652 RepID=A0AAD4KWI8_9EURO|nr:uncharacterized protein BGW36DRAFT_358033 [Talaromyces proteolyticus]KAH8698497.1 hypothetical protein BGW36DRAFT_358033 [Talaromyces proteolyticus]